jgi:hypothetical protein
MWWRLRRHGKHIAQQTQGLGLIDQAQRRTARCSHRHFLHALLEFSALAIGEYLDHTIHAIVSRGNCDFIGTHTPHTLGHQRLAALGDAVGINMAQNVEFGPQMLQQVMVNALHFLALGADADAGADHLDQGNQVFEGPRTRCHLVDGTIGEQLHPVQYTNGQFAPACMAEAVRVARLSRRATDTALVVAVEVVFTLLGIEFEGAEETLGSPERRAS